MTPALRGGNYNIQNVCKHSANILVFFKAELKVEIEQLEILREKQLPLHCCFVALKASDHK